MALMLQILATLTYRNLHLIAVKLAIINLIITRCDRTAELRPDLLIGALFTLKDKWVLDLNSQPNMHQTLPLKLHQRFSPCEGSFLPNEDHQLSQEE